MNTYFSEVDGCWYEFDVNWNGSSRAPLPGVGGIERRRSYLTEGAMSQGTKSQELPSQAEMRGKTDLTGFAGQRESLPARTCINACGRSIGQAGLRQGYRRCNECRKAGLGGRPRAKVAA